MDQSTVNPRMILRMTLRTLKRMKVRPPKKMQTSTKTMNRQNKNCAHSFFVIIHLKNTHVDYSITYSLGHPRVTPLLIR